MARSHFALSLNTLRNRQLVKKMWLPDADDGYNVTVDISNSPVHMVDLDTAIVEPISSTPATPTTFTPPHNSMPVLSYSLVSPEHCVDTTNLTSLAFPDELPDLPGDLAAVDFADWGSWNASRRLAAVRRWISYASHKYGPIDRWAEDFSQKWSVIRHGEASMLNRWLDSVKQMIRMGRCTLGYLERAMEGELPTSVDEWRDLYT